MVSKALYANDDRESVRELIELAARKELILYAPYLLWYECLSVISQMVHDEEMALDALSILKSWIDSRTIIILPEPPGHWEQTLQTAMTITTGFGYVSSYDACFHMLALSEGCPFLTSDKKHYNKTKDSIGGILLFEDLEL